jgi:hypothetical protein
VLMEIVKANLDVAFKVPNYELLVIEKQPFSYFLAGLLSAFAHPILQRLKTRAFFHIRWRCGAHNLALYLELLAKKTNHGL